MHSESQDEVKQLSKLLFGILKLVNLSNFSKSGEAVAVVRTDFILFYFFVPLLETGFLCVGLESILELAL